MVQEGIRRITMRRIAECVEYSPTLLYRLFANKDDLMDHLIARGYEEVRALYASVLERTDLSPAETLRQILTEYIDYALAHPNHYRMYFDTSTISRIGDHLELKHGRVTYVVFQVWLDAIEACQECGEYRNRDPYDVFQTVWSRVHGLISLRLQHTDFQWMPLERHLEEALDLPAEDQE